MIGQAWLAVSGGLGAAACWGTADFLAKRVAEREGGTRALLWLYLVGFPVFAALALAAGAAPTPANLAAWGLVGVLNAGAYLALYRGFRVGTLAVVSTTNAAWASVTVALSALFLGERPGAVGAAGLALTLAGVWLVAYPGGAVRARAPGFREGIASALLFGASFFVLKLPAAEGPIFAQAAVLRGVGLAVVAPFALRTAPWRSFVHRPPLFAAVDSAGFLAFVAGLAGGAAYLVAPLGSLLTPVAVALGAAFYGERLRAHQWTGFALTVAGAATLAAAPLASGVSP